MASGIQPGLLLGSTLPTMRQRQREAVSEEGARTERKVLNVRGYECMERVEGEVLAKLKLVRSIWSERSEKPSHGGLSKAPGAQDRA